MSKRTSQFVCQECGTVHAKWAGQCLGCGAWNALVEEVAEKVPPFAKGKSAKSSPAGRTLEFVALSGHEPPQPRRKSDMSEFDRVCGGGLVPGCAILIGGDPGIGKSTLLLQVTAQLSARYKCAYISGEEAVDQVRLRAERLGHSKAPVNLASATNVNDILATLKNDDYQVVVIDSIQTMYLDQLDSAPGTVAQVRACAAELIRVAKERGICLFLVGHVTKEGMIAGPRVLEHMVDTVLYFEGERGHAFRILRAVKNRFGPTDEIGVFEMTDKGLGEVLNPSSLFLADRSEHVSGSVVFAGIEGTRPVLVEIQALVTPTAFGTPRRSVIGWDSNRLAMVVAVLESRCGIVLGGRDIYLNVAGGLRVTEPAADLAVAAALLSAAFDVPFSSETVIFGELALSGEIRPVSQAELRAKEAAKLGFSRLVCPASRGKKRDKTSTSPLESSNLTHLRELLPFFKDRKQAKAVNDDAS